MPGTPDIIRKATTTATTSGDTASTACADAASGADSATCADAASGADSATCADSASGTDSAACADAASGAASVPAGAARRAPRVRAPYLPPDLPAAATEVTDLASLSRVVTLLATTIVKAVHEGKSVTASNKRLIALAAEETRRAITTFERLSCETPTPTRLAAAAAPGAPAAPPAAAAPLPPAEAEAIGSLKRELAACVREEFGKLKAELSQDARRAAARAASGPTYAQMARHQAPQQQRTSSQELPLPLPPATRPAIVVATRAHVTSRQEAVEAFRRSISFRASSYAPARVQPVSRNKLRVEFDTALQRDDALRRLDGASEVTAEPARTLRPMLVLKGISKGTPPDELVDIVRRQNDCASGELALKFERKNRNPGLYSAVLVASPAIWRKLLDLGRVCVDHQRIHVERFSPFVQCFSCLQFGHVQRNCPPHAQKPCAHCASGAHQEPDCPVKDDKGSLRCYNCHNRNTKFSSSGRTDHRATSGACSVLRAMRARVEARVDYGSA